MEAPETVEGPDMDIPNHHIQSQTGSDMYLHIETHTYAPDPDLAQSPIHSHTTSYKKLLASKSRQGVFVLYCRIWVSEEFKKGLKVRAGLDDIDLMLV